MITEHRYTIYLIIIILLLFYLQVSKQQRDGLADLEPRLYIHEAVALDPARYDDDDPDPIATRRVRKVVFEEEPTSIVQLATTSTSTSTSSSVAAAAKTEISTPSPFPDSSTIGEDEDMAVTVGNREQIELKRTRKHIQGEQGEE